MSSPMAFIFALIDAVQGKPFYGRSMRTWACLVWAVYGLSRCWNPVGVIQRQPSWCCRS